MRTAFRLLAAALLVSAPRAAAQTTYTWNPNTSTTNWLEAANWTGGAAGQTPGATAAGLPTDGSGSDVAAFNQYFQGTGNGNAIDFGAAGGQLTLGAIAFTANSGAGSGLSIGNSSATVPGVLRLNGATVAGVPNVVLAYTGFADNYYFFQNGPGYNGGPGMTVALGGSENVIYNTGQTIFQFHVPIAEAVPGAALTVREALVNVLGTNTYTGRTRILGGYVNIARDAGLGAAPAAPTPGHLVLQPGAFGPATLSTNGATFELNANRGIAIGPTAGAGDAVLQVDDIEVPNFISTVTYNGIIADNGGTGRLVKGGGGVLVLGGANTFTGGTLHNGGELRLTDINALGTTGAVTISPVGYGNIAPIPGRLLVQATGTFSRPVTVTYGGSADRVIAIGTADFAGAAETVFSGAISLQRGTTIFQGGNTAGTRFTGPISGIGAIAVAGTEDGRTVAFDSSTGNNFTYTGGTTVGGGTLLLLGQSAAQSGTGTGPVTVSGGTLGGTGRAAGAVTVSSGGRITAGTSLANRTLTLGDTLAVNAGTYRVTLFGANTDEASRLAVTGAATLSNAPLLDLDLNGQTVAGLRAAGPHSYTVLTAGSVTGTFAVPNFASLGFEPNEWTVAYPGGTAVVLTFTPVPEPGTVLAVGLLGLGLVRGLRRRYDRCPVPSRGV